MKKLLFVLYTKGQTAGWNTDLKSVFQPANLSFGKKHTQHIIHKGWNWKLSRHFLDNISRISNPDFVATTQDILMVGQICNFSTLGRQCFLRFVSKQLESSSTIFRWSSARIWQGTAYSSMLGDRGTRGRNGQDGYWECYQMDKMVIKNVILRRNDLLRCH